MTNALYEFGRLEPASPMTLTVLALFAGVIVGVVGLYRRDTRRHPRLVAFTLLGLRLTVWLLVAAMFLEPQYRLESTSERTSRVVVAVDSSLSMTLSADPTTEEANPPSRWQAALAALDASSLIEQLARRHDVVVTTVDRSPVERARFTKGPPPADEKAPPNLNLSFEPLGKESRLGESLLSILREHRRSPLAGIVLVSDGQSTAGPGLDVAARSARDAKVPVFVVGLGTDEPPVNVRVADLRLPTRAFQGDEIQGEAVLDATGLAGQTLPVEVLLQSAAGGSAKLLEMQDVVLPARDGEPVSVGFRYEPKEQGNWQVLVRTPVRPGEIRKEDNVAMASLDVVGQKTRVLIVAGGPTREYRFLRNLLFREPSIHVAVHLQSASATASQDAQETLSILPEKREDLFPYDVIVMIDPDPAAIGERAAILEEWVAEQSGGLIYLAGPVFSPSLARVASDSPISRLLPVTLKEIYSSDIEAGRYRDPWPIRFTPEGQRANFLRLDEDPQRSSERWQQFAGVYWSYPTSGAKPGALTLAQFGDPRASGPALATPLLAIQFFGSGRVFYMGTGEWWRLRTIAEDAYDRFWIRLIREMSQGRLLRGSSRAVLLVDGDRFPIGTPLTVRAQVLGTDYRPLAAGNLSLSVTDPRGTPATISLSPTVNRPGVYEGTIPLVLPGEYRLALLIPESADVIERRLQVQVPQREFEQATRNSAGLRQLATESSGKEILPEQLATLVDLIEDRTETTILTSPPMPLWDNAWTLGFAVLLAGAEWLLRKFNQLA